MSEVARTRIAACTVCRRSKIKCVWETGETRCKRCLALGKECIRPDVQVGRQKGIKNKRVGLDKALFQVEQVVKRTAAGELRGAEDQKAVARLRDMLDMIQGLDTNSLRVDSAGSSLEYHDGEDASSDEDITRAEMGVDEDSNMASTADLASPNGDTLAVQDAENPLQLLARASYYQPVEESRPLPSTSPGSLPSRHHRQTRQTEESQDARDLQRFFAPSASVHLDVGEDIDPISLGLATEEEGEAAFQYFYDRLAHTRWGLDPRIYTFSFTRSRSAFLCTSIMAGSALFWPSAGALSKRLSNHVQTLANRVMANRYKSVEIVLAYMMNVPWMAPGTHTTNDETSAYISMATSIAIDLSLYKVLVQPEMLNPSTGVARGECLDPKTALIMDGYRDVDPNSERGILLLRVRERAWLALFTLERGMCLARGRPFVVPITRLLKDCDNWHKSPLADKHDGAMLSVAVLRRDLDGLFTVVRALCDGCQTASTDGSVIAQSIERDIERFFDQWYSNWGASIGVGPERILPPYVRILTAHLRLSIYGSVINHPTAPLEVRRFFRTAGLQSALTVMRTAIQAESTLMSLPNNTTIMISFAACFSLTLSAYTPGGSSLAPSIRKLINEAADVLERTGSVTAHRNGLSVLYGKYLRLIVRRVAKKGLKEGLQLSHITPPAPPGMPTPIPAPAQPMSMEQQLLWPEPLQFSTMSDDQVMQVLNQPGNGFEPSFGGLSWDDMSNFDWLHWPEFAS